MHEASIHKMVQDEPGLLPVNKARSVFFVSLELKPGILQILVRNSICMHVFKSVAKYRLARFHFKWTVFVYNISSTVTVA